MKLYQDPDPEAIAEDSTREAWAGHSYQWRGQRLAPCAIDREGDFHLHRHLVGLPALDTIIGNEFAMMMDAARLLWFLTREPEEWLEASGDTPAERAQANEKAIRAWAVENIPTESAGEAVGLFYTILASSHRTRPVLPEAEKKSHVPSPVLARNTSQPSPRPRRGSGRKEKFDTSSRKKEDGAITMSISSASGTRRNGRTKRGTPGGNGGRK